MRSPEDTGTVGGIGVDTGGRPPAGTSGDRDEDRAGDRAGRQPGRQPAGRDGGAGADRGRTVQSRVWSRGVLVAKDIPIRDLSDHLATDGELIWVDLCDPAGPDLAELAHELQLDPLAVEDVVAHLERTKAIRYPHYSVLTAYATRMATPDGRPDEPDDEPRGRSTRAGIGSGPGEVEPLLHLERVSAFILPRGLVTVRTGDGFDMDPVLRHWEDNADLLRYGVGTLVHGLLDTIVDGHFEAVQAIDDAMEDLEDGLFDQEARTTRVQRQTYQLRKDLVSLRRVALPMRDLVNTVLRHRNDGQLSPELNASYDDLYDHVLRVAEWTESLRDMVSTIFETNLSLQDQRLNTVMKKLTSWAAIIAVPTAITGWFGQNVPYPGFGREWGFLLSLGMIVGIALGLYVSFRRRGWL